MEHQIVGKGDGESALPEKSDTMPSKAVGVLPRFASCSAGVSESIKVASSESTEGGSSTRSESAPQLELRRGSRDRSAPTTFQDDSNTEVQAPKASLSSSKSTPSTSFSNKSRSRPKKDNNSGKKQRRTSQYVGVHWHRGASKWVAQISIGCRRTHLGYFDTQFDAACKYDERAELLSRPVNFKPGTDEFRRRMQRLQKAQNVALVSAGLPLHTAATPIAVVASGLIPKPQPALAHPGDLPMRSLSEKARQHLVNPADSSDSVAAILMGMAGAQDEGQQESLNRAHGGLVQPQHPGALPVNVMPELVFRHTAMAPCIPHGALARASLKGPPGATPVPIPPPAPPPVPPAGGTATTDNALHPAPMHIGEMLYSVKKLRRE